jgi:hypothetical protein
MPERTCRTCGESIEHIVALIDHDCDEILSGRDLTRSEQDTLCYVESRVVDGHAELEEVRMNHEDHQNLKLFQAAGLLKTGEPVRASRDEVDTPQAERNEMVTPVTEFTNEAWRLATECRQMRAARGIDRDIDLGAVRLLGDHVRAKVEGDGDG